jgi:hypothetical protein
MCPSRELLTLRVRRISVQTAESAEITVNPCNVAVGADTITAPYAGAGISATAPAYEFTALFMLALMILGVGAILRGVTSRNRHDG